MDEPAENSQAQVSAERKDRKEEKERKGEGVLVKSVVV